MGSVGTSRKLVQIERRIHHVVDHRTESRRVPGRDVTRRSHRWPHKEARAELSTTGRSELAELAHDQRPGSGPRRTHAQNSVIASTSFWNSANSGDDVIGSSAISLAMSPDTLTLPCMKAELASSSPCCIRLASS